MEDYKVYLESEVTEILEVGTVGLYEFAEIMRSSEHVRLSESEILEAAREVARGLVARRLATLVLLRWPKDEAIAETLSIDLLDDPRSWQRLDGDFYYALSPSAPGS